MRVCADRDVGADNPPKFTNPDGINFDIAWDFVDTAMKAKYVSSFWLL